MKTRGFKTTAVTFIFLLVGMAAFGQPGQGRMMQGKSGSHFLRAGDFLNLTDNQKTQMKDIRLAMIKEMQPLQSEMRVLKAEYQGLITAVKPDMKAINKNIDAQTKQMNQIMKKGAEYKVKFRNVLTEEQWLQLQSRKGMMQHKMMRKHQGSCGRGYQGSMKGQGQFHGGGWQE